MNSEISIIALSLQTALLATLVTVPLGMIVAWLLVRKEFKGKFVLDVVVSVPIALPPVVVGYTLLWGLGKNSWLGQITELFFF
jgi:molybdate transport system permease protein